MWERLVRPRRVRRRLCVRADRHSHRLHHSKVRLGFVPDRFLNRQGMRFGL